jgi:uncharacterized pyridoxamine 5'-phosphate oxidase family protein
MKKISFKNKFIAYFIHHKKLYCIMDLNRICFSDSLDQCQSRFIGHECKKANLIRSLIYIFSNNMKIKKVILTL